MGAGNVYRHDYNSVEESFVWETVQIHLPPLFAVVVAETKSHEASK